MTATAAPETSNQLGMLFQYTVEAYKTFQKLAETLPNPLSAGMFAGFARDERKHRDLLDLKYTHTGEDTRVALTLGPDLRFQDMTEGNLSYREIAEVLIAREKTMERKLLGFSHSAGGSEKNLHGYIAATKRAHVAFLERELEMIRLYPDWFKREDAEDLVVHGAPHTA